MSWIIAFIVAIICFVVAEVGFISKDINVKDWQWWAIGIGEAVGFVCILYIVNTLWS